jgi:phage shock protein A
MGGGGGDLQSRAKELEAQIEAAKAAGDYTTANALLKEQTTVEEQLKGSGVVNNADPEAAAKAAWLARQEQGKGGRR